MRQHYVVIASYDAEAAVWYVQASDIPGLNVEAETLEAFREVVEDVAPELVAANIEDDGSPGTLPILIKAEALAGEAPARA